MTGERTEQRWGAFILKVAQFEAQITSGTSFLPL